MPAGTIALTNNSTTVTGTGTNFSTELKANDFLVAIVGGVTYTLGVQSVNSTTGLTLITAYNGPTATGVAWTAVPNAALVGITAQVAADVAKAIRGLNLDKANWQQVYSASGNITVTLPDGSQYNGPSWNAVATSVTGKMDKSQNLADLSDKAEARKILGVAYGTKEGTVAQGNDSRLTSVDGKSGGLISGSVTINIGSFFCGYGADFGFNKTAAGAVVGSGTTRNLFARCNNNASQRWEMDCFDNGSDIQARLVAFNGGDFNAFYAGVTGCGDSKRGAFAYVSSDRALKENIQDSDKAGAWDRLSKIKTRDFNWKSDGRADRGFIAQELAKIDDKYAYTPAGSPIMGVSDRAIMADILDVLVDAKTAIQKRDDLISELQKRIKAIDGLDA